MFCFNWVAALGHRGGQEFDPLAILTPHSYSIFLCEAALFYFFVVYNCVLFYNRFVSPLLGGVEVAVGRTHELVGKSVAMYRHTHTHTPQIDPPVFFPYHQNLFFHLLHFLSSKFDISPRIFLTLNPSVPPFLFFLPTPGWETGHICSGTATLSHVALSWPSPKHTITSSPGNCLSLNHPTVVWRKWLCRSSRPAFHSQSH